METRSNQEVVREQAKRRKQKQCSTPEGKEKQGEKEELRMNGVMKRWKFKKEN